MFETMFLEKENARSRFLPESIAGTLPFNDDKPS
jgi:hypothetical protein